MVQDYYKKDFIGRNVAFALIVAAWKKARALKPTEFAHMVAQHTPEEIMEAIKRFEGSTMGDSQFIGTLEPYEALWILAMSDRRIYMIDPEEWSVLGIDAKKIMAEAKKEAEAKWDMEQKVNA